MSVFDILAYEVVKKLEVIQTVKQHLRFTPKVALGHRQM